MNQTRRIEAQAPDDGPRPGAIMFLSSARIVGGAERSLLEIVRELRARGRRCVLVAPEGSGLYASAALEGFDREAFDFRPMGEGGPAGALLKIARFRRFAHGLAGRYGTRLFYANTRTAFWHLAALGPRYIRVAHHRDLTSSRLNRVLYSRMDANIFISRFNHARSDAPRNGRVILNAGAVACDLPPVPAPGAGTLRMAMFARIASYKGHRLALGASALLRRAGRLHSLDIWGEPQTGGERALLASLESEAVEAGLDVRFRGFHGSPERAMRDYDCILHPSFEEPFGRVPVEAFSLGVPVIAHASGGTLEICSGSEAYAPFLFHDYTPEALAGRIAALFPPEGRAPALGPALAEIQRDVQRRFSAGRLVDDVEEVIGACMARRGGAPGSVTRSRPDRPGGTR